MNWHTQAINRCIKYRCLAFLKPYFLKFTRKARANVKYVVRLKTNAPYFELVKAVFPNAKIVTHRFHIVQQITRTLNQLRIKTMKIISKTVRDIVLTIEAILEITPYACWMIWIVPIINMIDPRFADQ